MLSELFHKVLIHDTKAIEETYSSFSSNTHSVFHNVQCISQQNVSLALNLEIDMYL